jgi:hypothetical protein
MKLGSPPRRTNQSKGEEIMKPQLWYCEMCGILGGLMYKDSEDAMSVAMGLGDQHRKASPDCENGALGLKCIVVENLQEPFILRPHESIKR